MNAVIAAMDRNVQNGLSEVTGGLDQYFSAHTQATAAAANSR